MFILTDEHEIVWKRTSINFTRCISDPCVYYKLSKTNQLIILGLFVDDVVIIYSKQDESEWFESKELIKAKYKIKDLGDVNFILGMRIILHRNNKILYLD